MEQMPRSPSLAPAQPVKQAATEASVHARWPWLVGAGLVALATAARLAWVLAVPTVPVSDFAMYRESASYLSEFGALDHGFIYMPGFVALLAWIQGLGGDLLAQKIPGVIFGGLGAAGLYVLTWRVQGIAAAVVATAIYALWPAGVAMSSVVGTDVPAAALIVLALGALAALADRRPWTAAIAFGAIMGLAAWVRAVALPLTVLAGGFWLAARVPWKRAAALTAAGVAATVVVLSPWAIRNLRASGALYFTDDHGGITALIGANPNSEGTYTRALNQMFQDVTGKKVLDEPHHDVDRMAYALAREWARFEPSYSLGLAAMKAERLFDPEQRLLYWSIFRPGVLVGRPAAWFEARHAAIADAADLFGLVIAGLALAGAGVALARRRFRLLALAPFMLALAATYTVFFAEPRYRIPIEMLALPFVAAALVELGGAAAALWRRRWPEARAAGLALGAGLALVIAWRLAWPPLVVDGGARLRARHRWAVTQWMVGDRARTCMWRPAGALAAASPLDGAPNGVRLRAAGAGPTAADLELGGGALAPGRYVIHLRLEATGTPLAFTLRADGGDGTTVTAAPGQPAPLVAIVQHAGGPLRLAAAVARAGGDGTGDASLWISDGQITPADQALAPAEVTQAAGVAPATP
jgi:4-amino-4-deoxy-L-arabinose transferase-like glycosyltransferase